MTTDGPSSSARPPPRASSSPWRSSASSARCCRCSPCASAFGSLRCRAIVRGGHARSRRSGSEIVIEGVLSKERRREEGVALISRGARVLRRGDVAHRHAAQAVLGTGPGGGDGVGQERKLRLGPDRLRLPRGASPHTRRHRSPETKCPYERSYQKVKHPTLPP